MTHTVQFLSVVFLLASAYSMFELEPSNSNAQCVTCADHDQQLPCWDNEFKTVQCCWDWEVGCPFYCTNCPYKDTEEASQFLFCDSPLQQCGPKVLDFGGQAVSVNSSDYSFKAGEACTYQIPAATSLEASQLFRFMVSGDNISVSLYSGEELNEAGKSSLQIAKSYNGSTWGSNYWIVVKANGPIPTYNLTIEEILEQQEQSMEGTTLSNGIGTLSIVLIVLLAVAIIALTFCGRHTLAKLCRFGKTKKDEGETATPENNLALDIVVLSENDSKANKLEDEQNSSGEKLEEPVKNVQEDAIEATQVVKAEEQNETAKLAVQRQFTLQLAPIDPKDIEIEEETQRSINSQI